jgi:hypothetical protein
MKPSRRDMMLAGLGLLLTGCASNKGATSGSLTGSGSGAAGYSRPHTAWPDAVARPRPIATPVQVVTPVVPVTPTPVAAPAVKVAPTLPAFNPIPRSSWARTGPIMSRVNPMNGVNRITVHHEGWTHVWFTDWNATAQRISHIRDSHVADRRWGDIGYHYIVDRAGRVWEGRNSKHQGAHVQATNEHNLGIMLLGNFDKQRPSDAQLATLRSTLIALMSIHNVPVRRVYTHQELKPTACPGKQLQPRVVTMRSGGYLV